MHLVSIGINLKNIINGTSYINEIPIHTICLFVKGPRNLFSYFRISFIISTSIIYASYAPTISFASSLVLNIIPAIVKSIASISIAKFVSVSWFATPSKALPRKAITIHNATFK